MSGSATLKRDGDWIPDYAVAKEVAMAAALRRIFRALIPFILFVVCMLAQGGCTCTPDRPHKTPKGPVACLAKSPSGPTASPRSPGIKTVAAGTIAGNFSITSTGEATYVLPLITVPGRAGVEPRLALTSTSSTGAGVLGAGFSLAGLSAITRCPQNLADDGDLRAVRYDADDKLCLDGASMQGRRI